MRHSLLLLLVVALLASTALADEITLTAGAYLVPGRAANLRVTSVAPATAPADPAGVVVPGVRLLPLLHPRDQALRLGRPVTIRGQVYTPVTVAPWATSVRVTSAQPVLRPDELPPFPKKLAIISDRYYLDQLNYLDAYIDAKKANGWEVMVVSDEEWNPAGLVGQPAADVLRAWLIANYETEGIGFVLLAGNDDPIYGSVPMKVVWPLKDVCEKTGDGVFCDMQNLPTDYYYSDLTGNWDLDGDGFAGEHPDDSGDDGVDFGPEVIVGRFPVAWDISFVDGYFYLATKYETATDLTGRNRVLLPGAMTGFKGLTPDYTESQDGAAALDAMGTHLAETDGDLVFTRMFEQEGFYKSEFPTDYSLSNEHLADAFNYGHGLTIWFAHGYPTYTERMIWDNDDNHNGNCDYEEFRRATMLDSFGTDVFAMAQTQTFTWQISCLNGFPELEYNLGAMMLYTNAAGAIVASRSAFGEWVPNNHWQPDPNTGGSETLAYYWAEKMATGMPVGQALAETKATVPLDAWDDYYPPETYGYSLVGIGLHSKYVYNLYGDPTLVWTYEPGAHDSDWPPPEADDDTADDDTSDDDTTDDDAADDDAAAADDDDDNGCGC